MPQAAVRKVSFNGGVMAPYLDGRIDLARFATGCLESDNQIPCDWGGSVTRPGLVYDVRLNRQTVIHPYVVSASVSYLLLFSNLELRIVKDGAVIQDGGGDLVITTPYLVDDLYDLKIDSLIDLLWIAHPSYPPHQLTRASDTDWTFQGLPYLNPPMIPRAGETQKLTPSALTGSITLTSDADIFNVDHVDSYWRIGHDLEASSVELSLAYTTGGPYESRWLDVNGDWSFTTSGNWRGDVRIERQQDGETKTIRHFRVGSDSRNVATTGNESAGAKLKIIFENPQGGSGIPSYNPAATIEVSDTKLYGLVKITGYTDAQTVTATVIRDLYDTTATKLWEEGAWSDHRGYPSAVAVYERRLMFAASRSFPNRYWSSRQDDRQDFELGDDTQSAMGFDLPSRDVISWMLADNKLVVGTRREEVVVSSGRDDLPLSPENSIARVNGSIGSSRVPAIKSSNSILFAERRGRRIRELSSDPSIEGLGNTDITAFAPHILDANALQMSSAQLDQKLVFVLLSNRKMLCLNHDRDQAVTSWFIIETEGDFESVASLPGDLTEDTVYFITRRTINGQEVRQLEHFATEQWELIEQGDPLRMVYSDMARVFESVSDVSEITGLEDWEGEEVQVLGDGSVQPNKTVTGGKIDLTYDAKIVVLGLPFKSNLTPLWFDDVQSPTQGRKRKIAKLYTSMYQGGNVTIYATDDDVFGTLEPGEELQAHEISRRNFSDTIGEAPRLENGYFDVSLESRHSRRQSVTFERNSPLPMVIQSLHLIYNVGEK